MSGRKQFLPWWQVVNMAAVRSSTGGAANKWPDLRASRTLDILMGSEGPQWSGGGATRYPVLSIGILKKRKKAVPLIWPPNPNERIIYLLHVAPSLFATAATADNKVRYRTAKRRETSQALLCVQLTTHEWLPSTLKVGCSFFYCDPLPATCATKLEYFVHILLNWFI